MSLSATLRISSYAAYQTDESLAAYAGYIQETMSASSVCWMMAYRGDFGRKLWYVELLDGWKVMDITYPLAPELTAEADKVKQQYLEMSRQQQDISPLTRLALDTVGSHRSLTMQQALDHLGLESHWVQAHKYKQFSIGDRILGVFNMGAEAESYLLVDRAPEQEKFRPSDQDELLSLTTAFPRLHYWLALERGLLPPATRPLSPRQQELIQMMLKGLSEQEIADDCSLSKSTVHSYLMDIYRIFQVKSRTALQRLWLESI